MLVLKIIQEHNIDSPRIWNCDESCATPGRAAKGKQTSRVYVERAGAREAKIEHFLSTNMVTMLSAVNYADETVPLMLVFKGSRLPYRVVVQEGINTVQRYAGCLPRESIVSRRCEGGGVDIKIFLEWCEHFICNVRDLTRGGRKLLLILDGYRSHMSLAALEAFDFNNVIVYALPAHTSGKTQPFGCGIFLLFKGALKEAINLAVAKDKINTWDTFAFCSMLRYAYKKAFTNGSIISAFCRSGIWPLDAYQLLSIPRPQSHMHQVTMSVAELEQLLQVQRTEIRHSVLGSDVNLTHIVLIDTTRGQILTSYNAMNLA